jgi:hypothetical protein
MAGPIVSDPLAFYFDINSEKSPVGVTRSTTVRPRLRRQKQGHVARHETPADQPERGV